MKRLFILFLPLALLADIDDDDFGSQKELLFAQEDQSRPFALTGSCDWVGKADFDKDHKGHFKHLEFGIADINAGAVFYYNPCYKEGLFASAGYTYTHIKWDHSPFSQTSFNTLSVAIAGFSDRATDWFWQTKIQANFDLNHFKLSEYTNFDLLLWGRYTYTECLGLHIGVLAFTGMKIDRLYPIIGFDWTINPSWELRAVFPVDMRLIYHWTDTWSLALAARAFDDRYRTGPTDTKWSRGLVEYRAGGVEVGATYASLDGAIKLSIHVGDLIGGTLKISNSHHRHIQRHRFGAAPYAGAELAFKF